MKWNVCIMIPTCFLNLETRRDYLMKCIGHKYFDIKIFHEIRKTNGSIKIRRKLTKMIKKSN